MMSGNIGRKKQETKRSKLTIKLFYFEQDFINIQSLSWKLVTVWHFFFIHFNSIYIQIQTAFLHFDCYLKVSFNSNCCTQAFQGKIKCSIRLISLPNGINLDLPELVVLTNLLTVTTADTITGFFHVFVWK